MSDDRSRYPSQRSTAYGRAAVATSEPLAVAAGLGVLRDGGNAVDAAIATAAVLTVTEPVSNGLGSDAFALVWDGSAVHGLNASGRAPAGWTPERFAGRDGMPRRGWDSVTVPGAVSAWVALSERFGSRPLAELLAPAIGYAREGYGVGPVTAASWAHQAAELKDEPTFADAFLPDGRAPRTGERFVLKGAAAALEAIGDTHGEAFYRGPIAEALVRASAAEGGAHTMEDFAAHTADWVTPISIDAFDRTVCEIPPNGQGIGALIALGILQHLNLGDDPDGPDALHVQIEAVKLAHMDIYAEVADPRTMRVRPEDMLDPAYLKARAGLIDRSRAQPFKPGTLPHGGTVILAAADAEGRMVSFIQSNYMGFGAARVEPTFGISLQNRGAGFALDPAHPNVVGPGKRPFHTIIPGMVLSGGEAEMAFGVMGGPIQPQGHTQLMVRLRHFGQSLQTAVNAPRFRVLDAHQVAVEAFPEATLEALAARGHQLVREAPNVAFAFGGAQAVRREGDRYAAASDPRKDGYAGVI